MTDKYTLQGKTTVAEPDLVKWARWFESANRVVLQEKIGDFWVSTVFLGIDHNFNPAGQPLLFETMVFGDDELEQRRYATWDEAVSGHNEIVERYENYLMAKQEKIND